MERAAIRAGPAAPDWRQKLLILYKVAWEWKRHSHLTALFPETLD